MRKLLMYLLLLGSAGLSADLIAQTPRPPKPVDVWGSPTSKVVNVYGLVENGKYSNSFFGFNVTAPEHFTAVESEAAKLAMKAGTDLLKTGSNTQKLDTAAASTLTLITFLQKPSGTPGNAVLEIVAAKQQPGVTANMALLASTNVLTSNPSFRILKSLDRVKFGGRAFAGASLIGEVRNVTLNIESYVIMLKGYSVHFTISSTNESGRTAMLDVLQTIEFAK